MVELAGVEPASITLSLSRLLGYFAQLRPLTLQADDCLVSVLYLLRLSALKLVHHVFDEARCTRLEVKYTLLVLPMSRSSGLNGAGGWIRTNVGVIRGLTRPVQSANYATPAYSMFTVLDFQDV